MDKVMDLHFLKDDTDLLQGWKSEECDDNLRATEQMFKAAGNTLAPRVMSLAEAYR